MALYHLVTADIFKATAKIITAELQHIHLIIIGEALHHVLNGDDGAHLLNTNTAGTYKRDVGTQHFVHCIGKEVAEFGFLLAAGMSKLSIESCKNLSVFFIGLAFII